MSPPGPEPEVHIASFVVQHRESASKALAAMIDTHDDLELALAGDTIVATTIDGSIYGFPSR